MHAAPNLHGFSPAPEIVAAAGLAAAGALSEDAAAAAAAAEGRGGTWTVVPDETADGGCVNCALETCAFGQSCERRKENQASPSQSIRHWWSNYERASESKGRREREPSERTLSSHLSCFSHASLLSTNPDSLVATGLGCEYGHWGLAQSTPCLQIESCVGLVGKTTGGPAGW